MNLKMMKRCKYIREYGAPEWSGIQCTDNIYIILDKEDRIVGNCELVEISEGEIHISNMCIRYERMGYGREFVKLLKNKYSHVQGETPFEAIEFWKKIGADVYGDCFDEDKSDELVYKVPSSSNLISFVA